METIASTVSRLRQLVKANKMDAFITDRYLYSMAMKHAKMYIKQLDDQNKLARMSSMYELIPRIELIEVDKVEACCSDIKTGCTFMRSKDQLPALLEGSFGPLIGSVTSIDGSTRIHRTQPSLYLELSNSTFFKYNKTKYYWIVDNYLYAPNIDWEAVSMSVIPSDSISIYKCNEDCCKPFQANKTHIPDFLLRTIENDVKNDLLTTIQIPQEEDSNNMSKLKD